jgi:hypothetical protein
MRCHSSLRNYICVYCGERGDSVDHIPPRFISNEGMIVRACRRCNGYLFNFLFLTIEDRREYLIKRGIINAELRQVTLLDG